MLDAAELSLPHLQVALPWERITRVDLGITHRPGLCLFINDDLGVPVAWMAEPPERVLAAAREHLTALRAPAPAEN